MPTNKRLPKLLKFDLRESLIMTDFYTIIMLIIYTFLALFFFNSIDDAHELILINITILIGVISIAVLDSKYDAGELFKIFRRIYIIPLVFLIYSQIQYYIPLINTFNADPLLIKLDFAIFKANPTDILYQISNPILTEYLQIAYFIFYLLPLSLAVELHIRGDDENYDRMVALIIFSFYFSYLMYFFLPAIGPRFTLYEFSNLSAEMPGIWLTETLRIFVNSGGNIYPEAQNPELSANKDCMPSGHTWITLVTIYLAFKNNSKIKVIITMLGISLIFATVYLRYHYVVDLIVGAIFAFISIKIEPILLRITKKKAK